MIIYKYEYMKKLLSSKSDGYGYVGRIQLEDCQINL